MFSTVRTLLLLLVIFLTGCGGMTSNYVPPTVNLQSFNLMPPDGLVPQFELGIQVINPNRDPLKIEGIHYTIGIEGHKILTGVASNLPIIQGYGKGTFILESSADLLTGSKLLTHLLTEPKSSFRYTLIAKLDLGRFLPPISVLEEGDYSPLENL